jgi:hypothetical protein
MTIAHHLPEFETWHALKYVSTFAESGGARPQLELTWLYDTPSNYWLAATDSYTLGWAVIPKRGMAELDFTLPTNDHLVCGLDHTRILAVKHKPSLNSIFDITLTRDADLPRRWTWQLPGSNDSQMHESPEHPLTSWRGLVELDAYKNAAGLTAQLPWFSTEFTARIAKAITAYVKGTKIADTPWRIVPSTLTTPALISIPSLPLGGIIMPVRTTTNHYPWK